MGPVKVDFGDSYKNSSQSKDLVFVGTAEALDRDIKVLENAETRLGENWSHPSFSSSFFCHPFCTFLVLASDHPWDVSASSRSRCGLLSISVSGFFIFLVS